MIQETLVLIKPDGVRRRMMGQIITAIESRGLIIEHLELTQLSKEQAENLYEEHKGKWYFSRNIKHIISGLVVVIQVKGEDAVNRCRSFVKSYREANKDIIKLPHNLVHATSDASKTTHELSSVLDLASCT